MSGRNGFGTGRPNRIELGRLGERLAMEHLQTIGWTMLDANWKCRSGEIDLIADEAGTVVFVEVRTRTASARSPQLRFGTPQDSVDARKQRQVRETAQLYLHRQRLHERKVRFDVIAVLLDGNGETLSLDHVRGAF